MGSRYGYQKIVQELYNSFKHHQLTDREIKVLYEYLVIMQLKSAFRDTDKAIKLYRNLMSAEVK